MAAREELCGPGFVPDTVAWNRLKLRVWDLRLWDNLTSGSVLVEPSLRRRKGLANRAKAFYGGSTFLELR